MPIREGCWSAQGPGNGGIDAAMSKIAKPSPALHSKEHAELAVAATPSADDCPAAHIPIHILTHISLHCLQGKLARRMACDRPHQRSWLRRFRTHARLGSFQAFSRTLDASSADAVHTSQGSGADPSFLTPREGGGEGSGGIRSHTMSPSCEFLSSIQKRYLGFLAALHTQPNGDLVEVR